VQPLDNTCELPCQMLPAALPVTFLGKDILHKAAASTVQPSACNMQVHGTIAVSRGTL